jgi:hypothetical protein
MQEIIERLERIEAALAAPPREYLDTVAAAEFIGVSRQTMELWRMEADGPAYHRIGRRVLYGVADLRAFMVARRKEPLA